MPGEAALHRGLKRRQRLIAELAGHIGQARAGTDGHQKSQQFMRREFMVEQDEAGAFAGLMPGLTAQTACDFEAPVADHVARSEEGAEPHVRGGCGNGERLRTAIPQRQRGPGARGEFAESEFTQFRHNTAGVVSERSCEDLGQALMELHLPAGLWFRADPEIDFANRIPDVLKPSVRKLLGGGFLQCGNQRLRPFFFRHFVCQDPDHASRERAGGQRCEFSHNAGGSAARITMPGEDGKFVGFRAAQAASGHQQFAQFRGCVRIEQTCADRSLPGGDIAFERYGAPADSENIEEGTPGDLVKIRPCGAFPQHFARALRDELSVIRIAREHFGNAVNAEIDLCEIFDESAACVAVVFGGGVPYQVEKPAAQRPGGEALKGVLRHLRPFRRRYARACHLIADVGRQMIHWVRRM